MTGIRKTIYFSNKKDSDLVSFIQSNSCHYDVSTIAKDLMRDGLKYRSKGLEKSHTNVIQEKITTDFSEVELVKTDLSDDDIDDRLDSF